MSGQVFISPKIVEEVRKKTGDRNIYVGRLLFKPDDPREDACRLGEYRLSLKTKVFCSPTELSIMRAEDPYISSRAIFQNTHEKGFNLPGFGAITLDDTQLARIANSVCHKSVGHTYLADYDHCVRVFDANGVANDFSDLEYEGVRGPKCLDHFVRLSNVPELDDLLKAREETLTAYSYLLYITLKKRAHFLHITYWRAGATDIRPAIFCTHI